MRLVVTHFTRISATVQFNLVFLPVWVVTFFRSVVDPDVTLPLPLVDIAIPTYRFAFYHPVVRIFTGCFTFVVVFPPRLPYPTDPTVRALVVHTTPFI